MNLMFWDGFVNTEQRETRYYTWMQWPVQYNFQQCLNFMIYLKTCPCEIPGEIQYMYNFYFLKWNVEFFLYYQRVILRSAVYCWVVMLEIFIIFKFNENLVNPIFIRATQFLLYDLSCSIPPVLPSFPFFPICWPFLCIAHVPLV